MRPDVERDLKASSKVFAQLTWPAISPICSGGRLIPVEGSTTSELQNLLDQRAGIDGWQVFKVEQHDVIRSIASRVQWSAESWRSFTLRYQRNNGSLTEVAKWLFSYDHPDYDLSHPALVVQSYTSLPRGSVDGPLLEAAVMRWHDLVTFMKSHPPEKRLKKNPEDGTLFAPYWWEELRRAGLQIGVVTGDGQRVPTPYYKGYSV